MSNLKPKAAWLLLLLSAAYQAYAGLSTTLLPLLGDEAHGIGIPSGTAATGALQLVVAVIALRHAARRNLRGAILAVAACVLLSWLTTVPPALRDGLDFEPDIGIPAGYFILSPIIACIAAALAWRGSHTTLAAFIVTAPTVAGVLFTIAFAISIALYGL